MATGRPGGYDQGSIRRRAISNMGLTPGEIFYLEES